MPRSLSRRDTLKLGAAAAAAPAPARSGGLPAASTGTVVVARPEARGVVTVAWRALTAGPAAGQDTLRVSVPDNVRATVSLPAGSAAYRASGAGAPRYVGTKAGRAIYTVGSGVTTFTP